MFVTQSSLIPACRGVLSHRFGCGQRQPEAATPLDPVPGVSVDTVLPFLPSSTLFLVKKMWPSANEFRCAAFTRPHAPL